MPVPENGDKQNGYRQRINGKRSPYAVPVFHIIGVRKILLNHDTTDGTSEQGTKSVRHHHEHSLGACPDIQGRLCINKHGSGNIEKIEGHTIYNAG